jgi:uncharacterized protein YhdP
VRAVRIGLVVLAGVAVTAGVAAVALDRYVRSDGFRQRVLATAHDALGADVRLDDLEISLWSGATLRRLAVANPAGFPGDLLTADALSLHYRLWPLLWRRLEIDRVVLESPTLRLVRRASGSWNYEGIAARQGGPAVRSAARPGAAGEIPATAPPGPALEVSLPGLRLVNGRVLVLAESGRRLAEVDRLDLEGGLRWVGGTLSGQGRARIEQLGVADALLLRQLAAPVTFSAREIRLDPFRATMAEGQVAGALVFRLAGPGGYQASVDLRDADVGRLLAEAGATRRPIGGKLRARLRLEATGGLATVTGGGHAEILGGQLLEVPVLAGLALALRMPGLQNLRFEECRIEFTLAEGLMRTPVVRLIARDVRMTGHGTVSLVAGSLDHRLTLALPRDVVARAPREVRQAFTEAGDGFREIQFRVWGPYDAPRTDLSDRLLRGVTEEFLQRGLKKLFR